MKIFLFLFLILSGIYTHAQGKLEMTEDGKVRVSGKLVYYNDLGEIIETGVYSEMVNSQQYVVSFRQGGGDTLHCLLRAKDPARYIGTKVLPQTFQDVNGDFIVAGRENYTTVLAFWGDRCPPCIALIDVLDSLAVNYKNVDFIALATYGDVKQFYARHPWKNVRVPLEYKGEFDPYFPAPCVAIIDCQGILRQMYWQNNPEEVIKFLKSLK